MQKFFLRFLFLSLTRWIFRAQHLMGSTVGHDVIYGVCCKWSEIVDSSQAANNRAFLLKHVVELHVSCVTKVFTFVAQTQRAIDLLEGLALWYAST